MSVCKKKYIYIFFAVISQDALRDRRNLEAAEREWRRKEKEQTKKMLEQEERLKASRLQQITHKERMLSIQAGRERAEFERLLR